MASQVRGVIRHHFRRHKQSLRGIFLVCALAVLALNWSLYPDVFKATNSVVGTSVETKNNVGSVLSQLGGIAAIPGVAEARDPATEEAIGVLKGRTFCERFLARHDGIRVMDDLSPLNRIRGHAPTGDLGNRLRCQRFRNSVVEVSKDRKTGIYAISVNLPSPQLAAEWANELVDDINSEMRARNLDRSTRVVAELQSELDTESRVDTRNALARALDTEVSRRALASATPDYVFRTVDRAYAPGNEARAQPTRAQRTLLILLIALAIYTGLRFAGRSE